MVPFHENINILQFLPPPCAIFIVVLCITFAYIINPSRWWHIFFCFKLLVFNKIKAKELLFYIFLGIYHFHCLLFLPEHLFSFGVTSLELEELQHSNSTGLPVIITQFSHISKCLYSFFILEVYFHRAQDSGWQAFSSPYNSKDVVRLPSGQEDPWFGDFSCRTQPHS